MPIKGVSDARRLTRLGIIRLGIKIEGEGKSPYPRPTDHFVVPDEIKPIVGEKPTKLNIMFPSDDEEEVTRQYLRCYGRTHGLVCWGDGDRCHRKIDTHTGDMAGRDTTDWAWQDMTCDYEACPEYGARCRRVMTLMFMMPNVPGLGVWQINTSSFYSIREVNTTLGIIRNMTRQKDYPNGRISWIPLTLVLGPLTVSPPGTGQKTVYIMHIDTDFKLADIIKKALLPPSRAIVPAPEVEEPPEDLFPEQVIDQEPIVVEEQPDHITAEVNQEHQAEWVAVRKLMGEVKVNEKTARSYFANVCDVSVPLEELAGEKVPQALTVHMLREFRQRLEQSKMKL